jgi:hypothetical protein
VAGKTVETLVEDIYSLFEEEQSFTVEDTVELATRIANAIVLKFKPRKGKQRLEKIRPSNLGQPARKLWYDLHTKPDEFKYSPPMLLNFLYGDICEELMLWLAEQAGHTVTDQQRWIQYAGLRGKLDAKIDGYPVDAKSAFAANFDKFAKRTLKKPEGDPYGYVGQLSYYDQGMKEQAGTPQSEVTTAYFFAFNKVGSLCTMPLNTLEQINVKDRVEYLNKAMEEETPPEELCYKPIPDGKSGNMKLGTQYTRCPYKWKCMPDLKAYDFSPTRYLTHVEVEPKKNKDITTIERIKNAN